MLEIKSALHTFRFCICEFNQPWIENICGGGGGENPESSKKQNLSLLLGSNYLHSIYLCLGARNNLGMI